MDASIVTTEPMTVAFVRHVGPYANCATAWGRVCAWAGQNGAFGPDTRMLGMAWDDPREVPAEKLRYDACLTVSPELKASGEVKIREQRPGRYAKTLHVGPYENFEQTYDALLAWIPTQGLAPEPDRPALEFYLNDPQSTPPEQLRTEIYFPVK